MRKMYVQLRVCVVICDIVRVSAQHVLGTPALTAGRSKVAFCCNFLILLSSFKANAGMMTQLDD